MCLVILLTIASSTKHERGNATNLQLHMEGLKQMVNILSNPPTQSLPIWYFDNVPHVLIVLQSSPWIMQVAISEVQLIPTDLSDVTEQPQ